MHYGWFQTLFRVTLRFRRQHPLPRNEHVHFIEHWFKRFRAFQYLIGLEILRNFILGRILSIRRNYKIEKSLKPTVVIKLLSQNFMNYRFALLINIMDF